MAAKKKEPRARITVQVPPELKRRLQGLAKRKGVRLTDVVVEALSLHYPNFKVTR